MWPVDVMAWQWVRTLPALLVLELLHGEKAGTTGEELMAELSLVLLLAVDLVVVVLSLAWSLLAVRSSDTLEKVSGQRRTESEHLCY